jgi:signal transduction histidine kinase
MTRTRTLRLLLSLALALGVVVLGAISFHRKVQTFQPLGFEAAQGGPAGVVSVAEVQDIQTGLQPADQILLVDGGDVGGPVALGTRLRQSQLAQLTLLRGAQGGQVVQVTYHRPALDVDFPYLILSLIGFVYLLIGLFTLVRHRGGEGQLFYFWCLVSAAWYLLSPARPLDATYVLVYLGDEIAGLLLPALTVHLFLVFPSLLSERVRRWIPFLYLPAAVLLTLQLDLALANGRFLFGRPTAARLQALDRIEFACFGLFALAAVALMIWRVARRRDWEQQRQMQWVTFGVVGGYLPFLALHTLPFVMGLRSSELLETIAVLPLALVPLTFAWAILRYKLWDIEVIVRDTVSLTLTLLLGAIGFSLANLAITRGVSQEVPLARSLLSFASGLGIAGLLVPTRTRIASLLERFQYRSTFGKRRALSDLGRELLHERDLGRLCSALLRQIEEGVDLEATNLYLIQGGSLVAMRPERELPPRLPVDALGEGLWRSDVLRLSGLALPLEALSPAQRLFVAGYRYAFPLTVRGRGVGIALTGFKRDQTPLNRDDSELIRQLLNQAALAIENAQLVGQLHHQLEEVKSLQRYNTGILESSPAGIAVLDERDRIVSANVAFGTIAGVDGSDRSTLAGRRLADILPTGELPAPGQAPVEVSFCEAGGKERHLQISLAVYGAGAEPAGEDQGLRVLVVHDVSDRVAMENALKEQDRLAALGMLAAGVAHEVNTPITGISSYAQLLLSDTPEGHPHYDLLKKVERQTFRAARIVNNLLEFARNRQKERRPVALAPLLAECVDLLGERLEKRRIEVRWELPQPPDDGVQVLGCDGELQQVFTNLVLNAFDAMVGGAPAVPGTPCAQRNAGGRLTIRVEPAGSLVRVSVEDTGPGIPLEKLEAIFKPFYSTKLNRGGTGLGLSISSEIVRRHGGELKATNRPGEGACFIVELPRLPASGAAREASA